MKMNISMVLILILKFFTIIAFTLVFTFIMARLFPPAKVIGFDGLDYVLKPIYLSIASGLFYLLISLTQAKYEKKSFLAALLINFIYISLLFLNIL